MENTKLLLYEFGKLVGEVEPEFFLLLSGFEENTPLLEAVERYNQSALVQEAGLKVETK